MKNAILFLLLAATFTANSQSETKPQSLKDLLYSGKLKLDSTAVIKKSDDLSTKIDTSTKKAAEPAMPKTAPAANDLGKGSTSQRDSLVAPVESIDSSASNSVAANPPVSTVKSNTKIWKEYTDSLAATLKTELLPNKKIKKDTYFLTVDYEIGIDGAVSIAGVSATPENAFLLDEVKKRMELTVPLLSPVLDSTGKPRKVKRKYNLSMTKE
jgi:hypothetical protein